MTGDAPGAAEPDEPTPDGGGPDALRAAESPADPAEAGPQGAAADPQGAVPGAAGREPPGAPLDRDRLARVEALAPPALSRLRKTLWVLFGIVGPALAFAVDMSVRVNPLVWGDGPRPMLGGGDGQVGLRGLVTLSFVGLSVVGLVVSLGSPRSRSLGAAALPLLLLGVLTAGAHALAFGPLLPVSVIAIIVFGLGLLGLTPFAALAVFVDALVWAVRRQARLAGGQARWVVLPLLACALPLGLGLWPLERQRVALEALRSGGAAGVSRGVRELGSLAPLSRRELDRAYIDLDAPGQVRLRNLYLELFGQDPNDAPWLRRGMR